MYNVTVRIDRIGLFYNAIYPLALENVRGSTKKENVKMKRGHKWSELVDCALSNLKF